MSWLDRLKALPPKDRGLPRHRQNRQNPGSVSFDSAQVAQTLASEGREGTEPEQADDAREAFEERAGGLSREDAERQAAEGFPDRYARAREAREPPTSEADRAAGSFDSSTHAHARAREGAGGASYEIQCALAAWGDMRPCTWCRNLMRSGRCMSAWRGDLRAARDYAPTKPEQPQRCYFYDPRAIDPDMREGRERWPELASWQIRSG